MKKEIEIDGIAYVLKDSIEQKDYEGEICIVNLQRGHIYVGIFKRVDESDCVMHKSHTIRRWGTTKGLGELVENGPLENTVLDKNYGTVYFDYLTVVSVIVCNQKKWENIL